MSLRKNRGRLLQVVSVVAAVNVAGCENPNIGVPPPDDQLFFPSSVLLDPRPMTLPPPTGGAGLPGRRWLFVSNANDDRSFNGGTIAAVDLDAFWRAFWDQDRGAAYPYCENEEGNGRCVQPPGSPVSDKFPCRHYAPLPQVVECDEGPFVAARVRVGDFGTQLGASFEPTGDPQTSDRLRLWLPVRGDPSITFVDVFFTSNGLRMDCGQGQGSEHDDPLKCDDAHRLTHVDNDPSGRRLSREPFGITIDEGPGGIYRYAYVTHAAGPAFSVIDLKEAIISAHIDLFRSTAQAIPGAFGVTSRPCYPAGEGPLGDLDPDGNVPNITKNCSRPLVYASWRYEALLRRFTITHDDVGLGFRGVGDLRVGGLENVGFGGPVLGEVAYADPRGDELYVVQTNPGALLQIDTSLDASGEPVDVPGAPPLEVCQEPSTMAVFDNGEERLAFVACFAAAFIFVVDLDSFEIIGTAVGGTGPHGLEVDVEREVLYVTNTLEASITVVDISRRRSTRFTEIARLGLQEPFNQ